METKQINALTVVFKVLAAVFEITNLLAKEVIKASVTSLAILVALYTVTTTFDIPYLSVGAENLRYAVTEKLIEYQETDMRDVRHFKNNVRHIARSWELL